MNKNNFLIPTGIIIAGIVGLLIMSSIRSKPPKKDIEIKPTIVETFRIKAEDVQFTVNSQGTVLPRTESILVAEVSGVVTDVAENYVTGGYFKKGEMLMQIAKVDYEIGVKQAQARLAGDKARLAQEEVRVKQAEKEWALSGRSKKDAPALALRIPNLQEAQANVAASEADLNNAKLRLDRTTIRAPYDGMVKSKLVDVGQYVNVGTQLAKTFAVDYAEVRLPLTNRDLEFLKLPQPGLSDTKPLKVILSATIGTQQYQWDGWLTRSEGIIDTRSRTHYGVVQIDDPYGFQSDRNLPPLIIGSFVKAKIDGISMTSLIKIPRSALKGEDTIIIMDAENKLQVKQVKITRGQDDWVYLQQGLEPGDKLVLTALESTVSGMELRDQEYKPRLDDSEVDEQLTQSTDKSLVVKNTEAESLTPTPR